jgi:hypothetical protein
MVHTSVMMHATSSTFFPKVFLGPRAAEDSERAIATNIIPQKQDKVYLQTTKYLAATSGSGEPYASTGLRSNRIATTFAVS